VKDDELGRVQLFPVGIDAFLDPGVLGAALDLLFLRRVPVQALLVEVLDRGSDQIEESRCASARSWSAARAVLLGPRSARWRLP
jgi:hypothetical protein